MITFFQLEGDLWYAIYENGVVLGEAIMAEDGYFYFWFDKERQGFIPAYMLRIIADSLDVINEPWDTIINNDPKICQPTDEDSCD